MDLRGAQLPPPPLAPIRAVSPLPDRAVVGVVPMSDPDGRWAFVARVNGKQRWLNVHTEPEAELLRFCHEFRALPRATRDKAIAILGETP